MSTAIVLLLTRVGRTGLAFAMTGLGAIGFIATIFTGLYPRVVSNPTFEDSLTISNAATGDFALRVLTVVALIFTPILLYQGWTYDVFRHRLGGDQPAAESAPELFPQPEG